MARAQAKLPKKLRDFFIDYRSGVPEGVRSDRSFEFRIEIIQKRAPKSEADLAVSFVRLDELSPEEIEAYEALEKTGRVIIRDKDGPAGGWMRPKAAAAKIEEQLGWRFNASAEFPKAWKHYGVRPKSDVTGEAKKKTTARFCKWDPTFEQYVYSGAFVDKVLGDCASEEGFDRVIGWAPKPLGTDEEDAELET